MTLLHWLGERSPGPDASPWWLALDLGSSQLSALLVNRQTRTLHPIYWSSLSAHAGTHKSYGLTPSVYLSLSLADPESPTLTPLAVGTRADELADLNPQATDPASSATAYRRILLRHLKTHLLAPTSPLDPADLQTACGILLSTLSGFRSEVRSPAMVQCGADGLTPSSTHQALRQLAGVVASGPSLMNEHYSRSLCDAILAARLVPSPAQIAIMGDGHGLQAALTTAPTPPTDVLVATVGAMATDLMLLRGEEAPQIHVYPYGDMALIQDCIALLLQTLHPAAQQPAPDLPKLPRCGAALTVADQDAITHQGLLKALGDGWASIPRSGVPRPDRRLTLQQDLDATSLGRSLQRVALRVLRLLADEEMVLVQVGSHRGQISRQMIDQQILWPYLQGLDVIMSALFDTAQRSPQAISQAICGGLLYPHSAIARWLQEKCPQAQVTIARPPTPAPRTSVLEPAEGCDRPSPVVYGMGNWLLKHLDAEAIADLA
jgi:hypothetical protein